jgi:pimeloyl-ACP methyl ester carboxylesterase
MMPFQILFVWLRGVPPGVLARGTLGMFRYDATDVLPHVRVPTLVVVGDRDPTTVPQAGQFIRDRVPGAELLTLAPAKHYGLIEHHARFAEASAAFVAEHTGAPAAEVEAVRRQAG